VCVDHSRGPEYKGMWFHFYRKHAEVTQAISDEGTYTLRHCRTGKLGEAKLWTRPDEAASAGDCHGRWDRQLPLHEVDEEEKWRKGDRVLLSPSSIKVCGASANGTKFHFFISEAETHLGAPLAHDAVYTARREGKRCLISPSCDLLSCGSVPTCCRWIREEVQNTCMALSCWRAARRRTWRGGTPKGGL
jgi:hypothetical protein